MKAKVSILLQSKDNTEQNAVRNNNEALARLLETIVFDLRNRPDIQLTSRKVKRDINGNTIGFEVNVFPYTLAFDANGKVNGCGEGA